MKRKIETQKTVTVAAFLAGANVEAGGVTVAWDYLRQLKWRANAGEKTFSDWSINESNCDYHIEGYGSHTPVEIILGEAE